MKKLTFKLIPFIIAVLIVISSVTFITLYLYKDYDNNKVRFVADYFTYEGLDENNTEAQIEDMEFINSFYYGKATEEIKFYDIKSGYEYTDTPSLSSKNAHDGVTFKDGVLHIPGYFDVCFYAEAYYSKDANKWTLNYYAYIYNVNYTSSYLIKNLHLTFVKGTGESPEGEMYGSTKLDAVIEEYKNGDSSWSNFTNLPSFNYSTKAGTSYTMNVYDHNATGLQQDEPTPYVTRLVTFSESGLNNNDIDDNEDLNGILSDLDNATFSIFCGGDTDIPCTSSTVGFEEIVRGTFTKKYNSCEEFVAASSDKNSGVKEGCASDLYKAGYGKFIFWRLFIEGIIEFVISGIIAFLFYIIWQDDENDVPRQKTSTIKPKKDKQKESTE